MSKGHVFPSLLCLRHNPFLCARAHSPPYSLLSTIRPIHFVHSTFVPLRTSFTSFSPASLRSAYRSLRSLPGHCVPTPLHGAPLLTLHIPTGLLYTLHLKTHFTSRKYILNSHLPFLSVTLHLPLLSVTPKPHYAGPHCLRAISTLGLSLLFHFYP